MPLKHRWTAVRCLLLAGAILAPASGGAFGAEGGAEKPPAQPSRALAEQWSLAAPMRSFDDVCFQDRSALGGLSETEARRWFDPVVNRPLDLTFHANDRMRVVRFRGLAKLHGWTPDATLRWSFQGSSMRVHFWSGRQGVALYYYDSARQWAAYRTTQPPGEGPALRPREGASDSMTLLVTDDRRAARLVDDTYEVRCQEGAVVLTKGDVRILTAPMDVKPVAVFFESQSGIMFRDLAMCRSGPAPDDPVRPHRLVLGNQPPASMSWNENCPSGAAFERLSDDRVELSAAKTTAAAWATIATPRTGLYEITVEVENATPGSGIFLADDEGQPLDGVEFAGEVRTSATMLVYGKPGAPAAVWRQGIEHGPVAYTGPRQWLRLVAVGGLFRCWTSGDGIHWGQVGPPRPVSGPWRSAGLFVQATQRSRRGADVATRRIQLRSLEIRLLDGITNLVPEALPGPASTLAAEFRRDRSGSELWTWLKRVKESRPASADAVAWRMACAVETLATNPGHELTQTLVEQLLDDGMKQSKSLEARLRLLQDAAMVWDARSREDALHYARYWERLGRSLLVDGSSADLDLVRRSYMAASLGTQDRPPEPVSWELARDRLLVLLGQQQWPQLHAWCARLMFWHQSLEPRSTWRTEQQPLLSLMEWAGAESGRVWIGRGGRKKVSGETLSRQSLAVPINREAYNVMSDLQTAADERLYPDAAHVLATMAVPQGAGLVPDARDFQLFTSFSTAVRLLVGRHPQIQQAANDRFKAPDDLRVRQAIAQCDVAVVESLAMQYYGTPAAAAAHQWLGDRLLSHGTLGPALIHYRQAASTASPEQQDAVGARVRLASAMLGRTAGTPVRRPVTLGTTKVGPSQFEQWVRQLGERPKAGPATAGVPNGAGPVASPVGFEPKARARLEGDVGTDAKEAPWPAKAIDWPARQLAVVQAPGVLLVANRFQVTALEPSGGKPRWTFGLGPDQGPAHGWSLLPMRPVVAGNQVYARMLTKSGRTEIVCIDRATGKKRWQHDGTSDMVSDPLVVVDRLFVLAVEAPQGLSGSQLLLAELDSESGEVLSRRTLFELRSQWAVHQMCQATVVGDSIVAALAGTLFCLDASQQVSWLRTGPWIPPSLDPSPGQQYFQPPLAADDRLYVANLGVPSIECVERETGSVIWRRPFVGLRRILDLVDRRLLVETADGLQALRADTGEVLWQREITGMLDGFIRPGPGLLLCTQRELSGDGASYPTLLWIDVATGKSRGRSPLRSLRGKEPMLGPIVEFDKRLWCFTGETDSQGMLLPQRNVLELVPGPAALPAEEE